MSEISDLAKEASGKTPWWATAPIYLSLGIVGVPSLIALGAGYYIVQGVSHNLAVLTQYNLSEITQLNEINNEQDHRWDVVVRFMDSDLKAQFQTCVNSAKTNEQRDRCLSPEEREQKMGLKLNEVQKQLERTGEDP